MRFVISDVNIWAVLVAIISQMIIGALWYSKILFGTVWMKLIGKTQADISKEEGNRAMLLGFLPAIVSVLLLAVMLQLTGAASVPDALIVGTILTAGFIWMSSLYLVLFENRSLALSMLNSGYSLVALNTAAVILTLWR